MENKLTEISSSKMFDGVQLIVSHESEELKCKMNFAVFLPAESKTSKLPVLYWLSGLTCNETNFIQKAGAQRFAAAEGVILVCPDTSPRGEDVPDEPDRWDCGQGAGFYIDATADPWKTNYRMYSYVTSELVDVVNQNFPVLKDCQSIFGHSMGGHGALICALKNPGMYKSVSAFAPVSNPMNCPWGVKVFTSYLGADATDASWAKWDATELAKSYNGPKLELLIDQGTEDIYYKQKQLLPENLASNKNNPNLSINLKMREGYDHSYYYVATFIEEHIKLHASKLKLTN